MRREFLQTDFLETEWELSIGTVDPTVSINNN
jgi:hypothetical protein